MQDFALWIALKSWYLWYSEQLYHFKRIVPYRCELLSKVDIFDIRNNNDRVHATWTTVVNCSQKLISLIFGTTNCGTAVIPTALWIALKSWYLWYSEQPWDYDMNRGLGCELLSKVDIFDIRNNWTNEKTMKRMLWIALKSWYLWYSEQLRLNGFNPFRSCELLSKVDIFDIRNNVSWNLSLVLFVVNCSQKLISLIFGTTMCLYPKLVIKLWIALKSWYLWYSEQLSAHDLLDLCSCELLSKVDIFDIRNNVPPVFCFFAIVVNCSQKLISLIFGTTMRARPLGLLLLWIALKSWYLWYSEQPTEYFKERFTVVNCSQKLISLIFGTTSSGVRMLC